MVAFSYLLETYPVLVQKYGSTISASGKELESDLIKNPTGSNVFAYIENPEYVRSKHKSCKWMYTLKDTTNRWHIVVVIFSLFGMFSIPILFYPLLLLDLTQRLTTL